MQNIVKKDCEALLTSLGKQKAFEYLQGIFGGENVYPLKKYKGFSIWRIEHYGEALEVWWEDEKKATIFTCF